MQTPVQGADRADLAPASVRGLPWAAARGTEAPGQQLGVYCVSSMTPAPQGAPGPGPLRRSSMDAGAGAAPYAAAATFGTHDVYTGLTYDKPTASWRVRVNCRGQAHAVGRCACASAARAAAARDEPSAAAPHAAPALQALACGAPLPTRTPPPPG